MCTCEGSGEVLAAFRQLRRQSVIACSDHAIHHVLGLLAATPTMYIPMANCVKVSVEKKTMTRFFLRVRAYRLSNVSRLARALV